MGRIIYKNKPYVINPNKGEFFHFLVPTRHSFETKGWDNDIINWTLDKIKTNWGNVDNIHY